MRKVVFAINMTADGYCSHEDGIPDEQTYDFFIRVLKNADVLLVGRVTYELMVPYWPDKAKTPGNSPLHDFARAFDAVEKVVFSTTLNKVEKNTMLLRTGVIDEVLRLRALPGKDILIDSLSLASQLTERGLIDEYHILVHPVLAGKGPRLYETLTKGTLRLELVESKALASGIVVLHYKKQI